MSTDVTRGERFRLRLAADIARQAATKGEAIRSTEAALAGTVNALGVHNYCRVCGGETEGDAVCEACVANGNAARTVVWGS
jgi:hypothetical protein